MVAIIIGVHGIGQQQSGRHQLLPAWRQATLDGLERASGRHQEPLRPWTSLSTAICSCRPPETTAARARRPIILGKH